MVAVSEAQNLVDANSTAHAEDEAKYAETSSNSSSGSSSSSSSSSSSNVDSASNTSEGTHVLDEDFAMYTVGDTVVVSKPIDSDPESPPASVTSDMLARMTSENALERVEVGRITKVNADGTYQVVIDSSKVGMIKSRMNAK